MSLRFHGQLHIHLIKGHGYMEGLPFAGDPSRVPRLVIRIADSEVTTKHWTAGGEMQWDEHFLFHIDCDGADTVTYTFHINLHGAERAIGFYATSLATTLSHVGPQWHQVRAVMFPGVTDAIKGEMCVEVRWYPAGTEPDAALIAKCSAVAAAGSKSTEGSGSLASRTGRLSLSVPSTSGSSGSSPSPHSPSKSPSSSPSAEPSLPKVHSLPSMPHAVSIDPPSVGITPGEWTEEEKARIHRHSLFPKAPTTPTTASSSSNTSNAAHFVHSSSLHGRLHADTRMFDDRNFLEHFAATSHIHEIVIWHHTKILAIQTIFLTHSLRIPAPPHGPPPTLSPSIMTLAPDELLLSIGGRRDDDGIRALTFVTSRQRRSFGLVDEGGGSGMGAGLEIGEDFVLQAPRGCRVVCLYGGWNERGINCFGMCYQHVESGATGLMPVIEEERRKTTTSNGAAGAVTDGPPRGPLTKQSTKRHM